MQITVSNTPDLPRLRARVATYEARLATILDENDALPSSDPAKGATCLRAADSPRLALVCHGCWMNPVSGERREAANAACRGVLATAQARVEMYRAAGDEARARGLEEWLAAPV